MSKRHISHKNAIFWNNVSGRREILSCIRKVKRTRAEARAYAEKHDMSYYKCPYCGKYHITKQKQKSKDELMNIIQPILDALIQGG